VAIHLLCASKKDSPKSEQQAEAIKISTGEFPSPTGKKRFHQEFHDQ
jgi:hypothetical protein